MFPTSNSDMKTNMRHITIVTILVALVLTASCSRNERDIFPAEMIPLSDLLLSWQVDGADVYTKAEQSVLVENQVFNIYVMLFDQNGDRMHKRRYYVSGDATTPDGYDDVITSYSNRNSEEGDLSRGTIPRFFDDFSDIDKLSNQTLTFCAIANYNRTDMGGKLDEITNIKDLNNLQVSRSPGDVSRNAFTMVAREEVSLNVVDGEVERIGVDLKLRRLDAKLTFNLTVDIKGAIPGSVKFEDMRYRVHNIPDVSYLYEREKSEDGHENSWDAAAQSEDKFSCMYEDANYETFDKKYENQVGGTFSFYLRENRPIPKKKIETWDDECATLYAMREAWTGADEDGNKTPVHDRDFTYAPGNATFVEITGILSYERPSSDEDPEPDHVFGDVTYIIHLGETGNNPNDVNLVNNYDVRRNVRYIYNVRITGIRNMEVEVSDDKIEERPGVEGDITVSSQDIVNFDAHYGRVLLKLNKANLLNSPGWNADTPFGKVVYNSETGELTTTNANAYDYKWVLFAINRHFPALNGGEQDKQMVKFPGVQAYDGGLKFHDGQTPTQEEIKHDVGNRFEDNKKFKEIIEPTNFYYNYKDDLLDDDACLRDINQLVNYLHSEAQKDNSSLFNDNGEVYVTAFCDEYTYIYNPEIEDYIHPGTSVQNLGNADDRLGLWKQYVNAAPRTINITPMVTTNYSEDYNTSITYSEISITQNSIKTIYDPEFTGTAWGLETVNETGKLTHYAQDGVYGTRTNTSNDGRTNFLNFWINDNELGSVRWTDVMTVTQEVENAQGLTDKYRDAYHACITRNRDLNGNNIIDKNEIFWYLAAKDQLSGLYIGEPALDQDAWMYQPSWINDDEKSINHFISSTYNNSHAWSNYWILWSEEGASWGIVRESGDKELTYDYRCIRNLGIDIANAQAPNPYANVSNEGLDTDSKQYYYTIDVNAVNSLALRTTSDAAARGEDDRYIPFDHERSQNNRPYNSFDVMASVAQKPAGNWGYLQDVQMTWSDMRDEIISNGNPCPDGWRVPNQREFLIMMSVQDNIGGLSGDLGIATSFSFNGMGSYTDSRIGFIYNSPNLILLGGGDGNNINTQLKFRCVRDKIN